MSSLRWRAALLILALIALTVVAHGSAIPRPVRWLYEKPGGDKLGHLLLAFGVTWLANAALCRARVRVHHVTLLVGSLVAVVLFTIEEGSQAFLPHRICDPLDLASDYVGIWLAGWTVTRERAEDARPRGPS